MSWEFGANGKDINLSITENGHWRAYGEGWHSCHPAAGDISFLSTVQEISRVGWSICPVGSSPTHFDPVGHGFQKFAEGNPNTTCAMISHLHGPPGWLNFCILASKDAGFMYYDLLKTIFARNLDFQCQINFVGLRRPEIEYDAVPTVAEFLHPKLIYSKPVFSAEVTIRFWERSDR